MTLFARSRTWVAFVLGALLLILPTTIISSVTAPEVDSSPRVRTVDKVTRTSSKDVVKLNGGSSATITSETVVTEHMEE